MVIYKHNLAEKLFGFAYSKEFLRQNTDLCGFVDDPNLSLDIDLAVEFHKALRSDPIAAEKVTNLLILSSSYIDTSTAEFYTDKMKTYPVFDDHINRINDLFFSAVNNTEPVVNPNALPEDERERYEIGRYINEQLRDSTFVTVSGIGFTSPEQILYERVSFSTGYTIPQLQDIAFNSNFNNAFKNALQDCLNSPCNLFSETSDSIASLANQASMMNSTTMPTWGELKKNFFNAIGGVPDTIFKKVPMSIQNSIIELGQIGQQAIEQSTEMFFAKPEPYPLDIEGKKSKEKLIQKALAGQSLNSDSQGYKYIPDLDSYLNVTKLSTKILKKAADDLGGCFNKFQQAARYEPFNPEQNKTFTSMDPIGNKVGDTPYSHNTLGKTNNDYKARTTASMSSCDYAEPDAATGSGARTDGGQVGTEEQYKEQYERVLKNLKGSMFDPDTNGRGKIIPGDCATYGVCGGTLEEWAGFFTRMANVESDFRSNARADINGLREGPLTSFGQYQMGIPQFNQYSGGVGSIYDVNDSTRAFIKYSEALYFGNKDYQSFYSNEGLSSSYGGGGGINRIASKDNRGISAGFGPLRRIADDKPLQRDIDILVVKDKLVSPNGRKITR